MRINVGLSVPSFLSLSGEKVPLVITATIAPVLASLTDGDTVTSAYTAGTYSSTAGTISSAVETVTINGTTGALGDVVSVDDIVSISVLVTDSAGNTRTFNTVTQTVAGVAPTASTAPTITGSVAEGETVTINEGTYTGTTPITITGTLTLNGADVSADMVGSTYTIPAGTAGQALVWSEVASNGTAPNATQSATETVAADTSGTITIDTLTYTRGTAGVAPDLASTVSSTGTTTANYTLFWATRSTGTALSKSAIENGTGDALENGSVTASTLAPISASLDLANSLSSGAIDAFIRDSSGTAIESAVVSVTGVTYDAVAPAFSSAVIEDAAPSSLVITLTKAAYDPGGTIAAGQFTLTGNTITNAVLTDTTTITLTLGTAATSTDDYTGDLAYTGTGLVGVDAEVMPTFTAQSVTNNVVGSANQFSVSAQSGLSWTARWAAPELVQFVTGSPDYWMLENSSQARNLNSLDSLSGVDFSNLDDVEVLVNYVVPADITQFNMRFVLRGTGGSGSETGYVIGTAYNTSGAQVESQRTIYNNGSPASTFTAKAGVTVGQVRFLRAQAVGDTVQFRDWADGDAEPATWDQSFASTVSASGRIGLFAFVTGVFAEVRFIGVGINGQAAPSV